VSATYARQIPVGNIEVVDLNTNPINNEGTHTITWTSAFKDFAYKVGDTIAVPVMWKTSVGAGTLATLPDIVLFTPEEADGTDPALVGAVPDGMLFTITFTDVQFKGGTTIFKGKVNLRPEVNVDYGEDTTGDTDWVAKLGTNVDVTNTAISGGDPPPTVSLSASPTSVAAGGSSTLTWSSTNATSCTASGGWSGDKATSGSQSVSPAATTTYTLGCTGPGGSAQASATVTVLAGPTFTGSATSQGSTWSAVVTVTGGTPGTSYSGTWNVGGTAAQSGCSANGAGTCTFTRGGIPRRTASATWTHTASNKRVTIQRP
jgi:hypothetical protein